EDLVAQRKKKLKAIADLGFELYPRKWEFTHSLPQILAEYSSRTAEQLDAQKVPVRIAGRVMTVRPHGKAGFAHLAGGGARLQVYVRLDAVGERDFELYKLLDLGDLIGVEGYLFRTRTGELTVHAERLQFLVKALLPLPEKWHGLTDVQIRYRQRYLDLMVNPQVRQVFEKRSKLVGALREFLESEGYLEVETPMMQPLAGGAMARPFVTHHNALDLDMYLRIAPELYLKRLIVGGFERVYEINRNFRNEGLSTQHNPEFTMLELYLAYADYRELMDWIEKAIQGLADALYGRQEIAYQGRSYDLSRPFARLTVEQAVIEHCPGIDPLSLRDLTYLRRRCEQLGVKVDPGDGVGKLQIELFEKTAESKLLDPTFVYAYPVEVSPLSRPNDTDPFIADRFEFFLAGREIANGFSELNDPEEQAARFRAEAARRG